MPHEPEMTPIEQELERALRTLVPSQDAPAASTDLAFALGRANARRELNRWRAGAGVLGVVALASTSASIFSAAQSPRIHEAGISVASSELPSNTATRNLNQSTSTSLPNDNPVADITSSFLPRASRRTFSAYAIEPFAAWRQTAPNFNALSDPYWTATALPLRAPRVAPAEISNQSSLELLLELLAAGGHSS